MRQFYLLLLSISLAFFGFLFKNNDSKDSAATNYEKRVLAKQKPNPPKKYRPLVLKPEKNQANETQNSANLWVDNTLFAPSITAIKSVVVNGGGNPVPGSQLDYSIEVTNSGTDATGVVFTDVLNSNLTLVPGSVKASPIAVDDAYDCIGNVGISVPAGSGLLVNDINPVVSSMQATAVNTAGTQGTVNANPDGSFAFVPNVGFSGTTTFTYTISNTYFARTATVTINVSAPIWFVNISAPTGGTGTIASPFQNWSEFATSNALSGATNPAANQTIFVYSGTYTGAATLKSGQKVLGAGATVSLASFAGITVPPHSFPALPATGSSTTTLTSETTTITLPTSGAITLRGFDMGNSITNIESGASFGTLTISEMTLNGTGRAFHLQSGTLSATFNSITSTNSTSNGISLVAVAGTMTVTGGTTITNSTNEGIRILGSASVNANFGNTNITGSGTTGISTSGTTSNTSILTFGDLDIAPDAGVIALNVFSSITITCTSGTITTSNTSGTVPGIFLEGGSSGSKANLNMVLDSYTTTGATGALHGLTLKNTSGSFTINGTGTTTGSGGSISGFRNRGANFENASNITLKNMNFVNANTLAGTAPTQTDNSGANAALYFNGVTGITLDNIQMNTTVGNANAQNGINLFNCSNFSLANSTITRCGTGVDHACLYAINTTGTNTISNSTLSKASRAARFTNNSTNMTLKVTGSSFNDTRTLHDNNTLNANGQAGILFEGYGTSQMSLDVKSSSNFLRAAQGINAYANENSTVKADVQSSTFNSNNASLATGEDVGNATDLGASGSGSIKFNVLNNTITTRGGPIINVFTAPSSSANAEGTVEGNNITYNFISSVNNNGGSGIRVNHNSTNTATKVKINNNTLTNFGGSLPIDVLVNGTTGRADIICTNNNISIGTTNFGPLNDQTPPNYGIRMSAAQTGQTVSICTKTAGNFLNTAGVGGLAQLRASNAGNTHFFEGNNGGITTADGMVNIWNNAGNTPTATGSGGGGGNTLSVGGSGTLTYGATCSVPSNPLLNLRIANREEVATIENVENIIENNQAITNTTETIIEEEIIAVEDDKNVAENIPSVDNTKARLLSPNAGETVTVNGSGSGFTLPANKSTTIKFSATVSATPSTCAITNQASVSGSNFSTVNSNTTTTSLIVPPPTGVTTATQICNGKSIGLVATCSSGTVQWYNAAATGSLLGTSASLGTFTQSPTSNTTYQAACKVGGCESARTNSGLITVNAVPVPAPSSNTPVCSGNTVNLSSASATTYSWSGPNSFTSTVQNPEINNVTIVAGGTYTITQTNSFGCTTSATTSVTITPLQTYYRDMDNDGFGNPAVSQQDCSQPNGYVINNTDCNDNSALEKPGQTWYADADNDGYAQTGASTITQCLRPVGYKVVTELLASSGDCNDNNAAILPGATEICDGIDNNCNGSIDEGFTPTSAPTSPTATPSNFTVAGTTTLTASGCNSPSTITWYDTANSTAALPNNTPTISSNKTFFAKCTGTNTCVSNPSTNVVVTFNPCTPLGASPGNVNITWTGLLSTDWNTACNWNPAWVPDATNGNVIIPNTTNKPTIFGGTAAVAKTIEVQSGATLTIATTASLTVNGSKSVPSGGTTAFLNDGTVENNGQLTLGNSSSIGGEGLYNRGTFNNNTGGDIKIDRSTTRAILNRDATFNNSGLITIGALASVGQRGINNFTSGTGNTAMFYNNTGGEIKIDNVTGIGLYNEGGTVSNAAKITIGATVSIGGDGIDNRGTFNNNTGGDIKIDQTGRGLLNQTATFNNSALITIGASASVGQRGLNNFGATSQFNNNAGGEIKIDNATIFGLYNESGTVTNAGKITIGAVVLGANGLQNDDTFNNNACGQIIVARGTLLNSVTKTFTNTGLVNVSNTLTNNGTFTNNGVVKANTISSITNNKMVITNACPIFTLGGTNNYTVSGIFTDAGATTPAGTYTSVGNKFTANNIIPTGSQTLYAQVTDGTCMFVVPFDFNNVKPTAVSISTTNTCVGSNVTLSATCTSGTVTWYGSAAGTSSLGTGGTFNYVPSAGTGQAFYAACEATNCVSGRTITSNFVNVYTIPDAPTVTLTSPATVCQPATLNLTASGCAGTVTWSDFSTGTSLSISATGTYNVTATCTVNGCTSVTSTEINGLVIKAKPIAPTITPPTSLSVCSPSTLILTASGCAGTVTWSQGAATGTSLTLSTAGTYSISATCTVNGCTSDASTAVTGLEIKAQPNAPTITPPTSLSVCSPSTLVLTASGCAGTVTWSEGVATGTSLTLSTVGTYSISATCTVNGCSSDASTSVTGLEIKAKPIAPTITPPTSLSVCSPSTLILTASGCDGTVTWSQGAATGTSLTLSAVGTYAISATCTVNGCTSDASTSVTALEIKTKPNPPTITPPTTLVICSPSTLTLTASGCAGTVTWSQGAATGTSLMLSMVGTYSISATCTVNGCTSDASTAVTGLEIKAKPNAPTITPPTTLVVCSPSTLMLTASGCDGTVTWSQGAATGTSLMLSMVGTYSISATCTVNGCTSDASSAVTGLEIKAKPNAPTITPPTTLVVCSPSTLMLTASGCDGTVTWSQGAATGTSLTISTVGTYSISATCTVNGCTSDASSAVNGLEIKAKPNPPTIIAPTEKVVCSPNTLTLTANCTLGTVVWSTGATGSSLTLSTIGTYSISASCTTIPTSTPTAPNGVPQITGCTSEASADITGLEIKAKPNAPSISPPTTLVVCSPSTLMLTASGCAGTVTWSQGAATGTSLTISTVGTYSISATCTVNGCTSDASSAVNGLEIKAKPNPPTIIAPTEKVVCSPNTLTLTANCTLGTVVWSTGATGSSLTLSTIGTYSISASCTTIPTSTPTAPNGVPQITGCTSEASADITDLEIKAKPNAPSISPPTTLVVCSPSTLMLTASGCAGTVTWSQGAATGTSLTLSTAGTYSISATCTVNGCTSDASTAVTGLEIKEKPNAPTITPPTSLSVCSPSTLTLTASGCAGTVTWSQGAATGTSLMLSMVGTYSISATCTVNGCTSDASSAVNGLEIKAKPNAPTISPPTTLVVCSPSTLMLTASGCAGTVTWSQGAATGTSLTISTVGTYSISATCTVNGCTSDASSAVNGLEIKAKPNPPTIIAPTEKVVCSPNTLTLTANCTLGTVVWSTGATGSSLTLSTIGTYSISATCTTIPTSTPTAPNGVPQITGCTSDASADITGLEIKAKPNAPSISPPTTLVVCSPLTLMLTASGCAGTVTWSEGAATGTSLTLSTAGTYSISATCTVNGCTSDASAAVTGLEIQALPIIQATNTGPYTIGQTIVLNATGGSLYSWSGPNSFSSSLASPTITNALPVNTGIYTVTATGILNACTTTATTEVSINGLAPCDPNRIVDYSYVKAGSPFQYLFPLTNGMIINEIPAQVSVLVSPPVCPSVVVESFHMTMVGPGFTANTTQNISPYAIFDNSGLNVIGRNLSPGNYTLTVTGYRLDNRGGGVTYGPKVITFTIVGNPATISTPTIAATELCAGSNINVNFTSTGTFNLSNQFQVQISDATGSWIAPVVIGTSNSAGNIVATIPQSTPEGSNYRIRVVSTNQVLAGSSSGALTIIPLSKTLVSPTNNLTGTNTQKAANAINASNKITSPANVTYQAGKSILLTPGFESGAVFKAQIQGCSN